MSKTYCIIGEELPCASHFKCWKSIVGGLAKLGYVRSGSAKKSSIILVRHCCLTSIEIEQVIYEIKKLAKNKVGCKIFLGECISRTRDLVDSIKLNLPNHKVFCFTSAEEFFEALGEDAYKEEQMSPMILEDGSVATTVTYGCNMKCAFCKTAYMDYEFRSTPLEEIIMEVNAARKIGCKKVILDAMNITEYSYDGKKLADLLCALLEIPDVIYQVNGIVMAELSDEALKVLQDPRFYCVQVELQSFIPEVRKKMGVGDIPTSKILNIFESLKGKLIVSNVMVGFCREHDSNFKEQLKIIEENNLFFLTVNNLIPTPGTKSSEMANPSEDTANLRLMQLTRLITILRKNVADSMLGNEQNCTVIRDTPGNAKLALAENGVLIYVTGETSEIGTKIKATPRSIENYFGAQQTMILSTELNETSNLADLEERMIMEVSSNIIKANQVKGKDSHFNNNPISLKDYCNMCFGKKV